jgi:multidrug transporter EmrE-like cation transporter
MTQNGLLLVLFCAICSVLSNLLLRSSLLRSGGFAIGSGAMKEQVAALIREPLFLIGLLCYIVATVVWLHVVSRENLSVSYPLLISLTFLLVTSGAVYFFHEPLSLQKIIGLGLILAGVVVVSAA